jgi:hypothetical protein
MTTLENWKYKHELHNDISVNIGQHVPQRSHRLLSSDIIAVLVFYDVHIMMKWLTRHISEHIPVIKQCITEILIFILYFESHNLSWAPTLWDPTQNQFLWRICMGKEAWSLWLSESFTLCKGLCVVATAQQPAFLKIAYFELDSSHSGLVESFMLSLIPHTQGLSSTWHPFPSPICLVNSWLFWDSNSKVPLSWKTSLTASPAKVRSLCIYSIAHITLSLSIYLCVYFLAIYFSH